eukprot:Tamp_12371.p1 GENE.Tamp_12371~~Tamp_12371.p1  ORF type:complete len:523 (+),score=121.92 Tamp_12371:206-1774(+)
MEPHSVLFMDEASHGYTFLNVATLQELEEAGRQRFASCEILPAVFFGEKTRVKPKDLIVGRILKSPARLVLGNENGTEHGQGANSQSESVDELARKLSDQERQTREHAAELEHARSDNKTLFSQLESLRGQMESVLRKSSSESCDGGDDGEIEPSASKKLGEELRSLKIMLEMNNIRMSCLEGLAQRASDYERTLEKEQQARAAERKQWNEEREQLFASIHELEWRLQEDKGERSGHSLEFRVFTPASSVPSPLLTPADIQSPELPEDLVVRRSSSATSHPTASADGEAEQGDHFSATAVPETEGGSNAPASESVTTTECSSLEVVELRAKVAGLEHEVLGLRAQHLEAEEAAKEDRDRARLAESEAADLTRQLDARDACIQERNAREISLQQAIQDLSLAKVGLEVKLHQLESEDKHSDVLQLRDQVQALETRLEEKNAQVHALLLQLQTEPEEAVPSEELRETRMKLMIAETRISTLEDMASRSAALSEELARVQREHAVDKRAWDRERQDLVSQLAASS